MSAKKTGPAKKLIMIPYAELEGYRTGANVQNVKNRVEMYMKNCSVACISARTVSPIDTDVMLVSNVDIPEPYKGLLTESGVLIRRVPFDRFDFGSTYTWSLAFYKLCALYSMVRESTYEYYSYFDADVYFQHNLDNVWSECDDNVMLYDINHGLQVADYCSFLEEIDMFLGYRKQITHYGGEFFAASCERAIEFSEKCLQIYNEMREKNIYTTKGDEYIISLAADAMKPSVKNAGAYVYRFWSGTGFRLISTCYKANAVSVLHVPAEKTCGIIKIYDRYIKKGRIPSAKATYRMLHLKYAPIISGLVYAAKRCLTRG